MAIAKKKKKAAKKAAAKSTLVHPRTGSTKNIDRKNYTAIKNAILTALKGKRALPFSELSREVRVLIRKNNPDFTGSIPWYTISVRLDLETKGIVETVVVKGQKLNRLPR